MGDWEGMCLLRDWVRPSLVFSVTRAGYFLSAGLSSNGKVTEDV